MPLEDHLLTESRNPHSESIDALSPIEIVRLMNSEDAKVVEAVGAEAGSIAQAIEWAADRFRRGGRLIYAGAGTSGPPRGPRCRRVPAHLQHAPRDGGRADRGRSRPR